MEYIVKHNINYLYHMTSIANLPSIMNYGLLSHKDAHEHRRVAINISNSDVQERRRDHILDLHSYVCLYFSARNPMLFVNRCCQDDIVIIGIKPTVLLLEQTIFTDGNAASDPTEFYGNTPSLDKLSWNIIESQHWTDYRDGKRIKCAEVLVYPKVELKYVVKLFCISACQANIVREIVPARYKHFVEIKSNLYFKG